MMCQFPIASFAQQSPCLRTFVRPCKLAHEVQHHAWILWRKLRPGVWRPHDAEGVFGVFEHDHLLAVSAGRTVRIKLM